MQLREAMHAYHMQGLGSVLLAAQGSHACTPHAWLWMCPPALQELGGGVVAKEKMKDMEDS